MKSNYNGIRGWLNYVRDYKDNKNFLTEDLREKELNDKVKEKDNLIALREKSIETLQKNLAGCEKRNDELRKLVEKLSKENGVLEEQLKIKESARRKNASAIGGLKAKINELKQDLEKANHKINFLENSKHAPSKEEVIAYETNMKEVYKKIQEKRKKHID